MPYTTAIKKIITAIENAPDKHLTLPELSQIACVSPFHLHRLFRAQTGIPVGEFCRTSKLKRAAHQLLFRPWLSITDIALDNGYQSPEAFSRAFARAYNLPPSQYRKQLCPQLPGKVAHTEEAVTMNIHNVKIVQLESFDLYELVHIGPQQELSTSIQRLIKWRREHKMPPTDSRTFNIFYSDPASEPPESFSMGLAIERTRTIEALAPLRESQLAGGRYAHLRHTGPDAQMEAKLHWLYGEWLPQSGETLGQSPLFIERVSFFPEVPENAMITDVYLPLAS